MGKTREIKGRIKAVTNIQRITKTMMMIATARFQAAQKRATASRPYTRKIVELVAELARSLPPEAAISHPLLKAPVPAVGRRLLLVITSNRGLCGGYNANVLRTAMSQIRQHTSQNVDLEVVGKKGLAYFRFRQVPVAQSLSQFTDRPTYDQVEKLADHYMESFAAGRYDAIDVAYMSFLSMARQEPRVLTLLPLRPPTGSDAGSGAPAPGATAGAPAAGQTNIATTRPTDYDFTPGPAELLEEMLPATVRVQLFQCFNEAVVGEQIARMVAMKAATDAAGKMKKTLTRRYNRARQTAITTELSEIIGGSAALV